jgi:hypothetical protein
VRKGTLVIDIIDADTDTLVWRSVADKEFEGRLNKREREVELKAAIRKMLKQIPVVK